MKNYYEVLGINKNASPDEVKHRYYFLTQAYHPDKFREKEQKKAAEEEFKLIREAYEVLKDPVNRAQYDRSLTLINKNEREKEFQSKHENEEHLYSRNKEPSNAYHQPDIKQNKNKTKSSNAWLWIVLIILIYFTFYSLKNIISKNNSTSSENTHQQPTIILHATPTISSDIDKANLLNTAQKFSDLLENGNLGAKFMLDSTYGNYTDYMDSIDQIAHDTLKWGKYLRIYALTISSYYVNNAKVSGYIENHSYYTWLKYYFDLYFVKKGNIWYIQSWSMTKT